MKHLVLTALAMTALAITPTFAAETDHNHHDGETVKLQLDSGKKWVTDAPLRKAMREIRQSIAGVLGPIHKNQLSANEYGALATRVSGVVTNMITQCKLPPAADAQLHIIVADILAGTDQMIDKDKAGKPRDGAIKVIGALDNYSKYFDDPGFKPPHH